MKLYSNRFETGSAEDLSIRVRDRLVLLFMSSTSEAWGQLIVTSPDAPPVLEKAAEPAPFQITLTIGVFSRDNG